MYYSPWGRKESDTTETLNGTECILNRVALEDIMDMGPFEDHKP